LRVSTSHNAATQQYCTLSAKSSKLAKRTSEQAFSPLLAYLHSTRNWPLPLSFTALTGIRSSCGVCVKDCIWRRLHIASVIRFILVNTTTLHPQHGRRQSFKGWPAIDWTAMRSRQTMLPLSRTEQSDDDGARFCNVNYLLLPFWQIPPAATLDLA